MILFFLLTPNLSFKKIKHFKLFYFFTMLFVAYNHSWLKFSNQQVQKLVLCKIMCTLTQLVLFVVGLVKF